METRSFKAAEWEGLGRLPSHLPSISSLLLFNTQENPYNVYATIDNLLGVDAEEETGDKKDILADAPVTVEKGEELVRPISIYVFLRVQQSYLDYYYYYLFSIRMEKQSIHLNLN